MTLAQAVRLLRLGSGMTLRKLEEASGVSNAYISQLETGKIANPTLESLRKLAGAFGIASWELLRYIDGETDRDTPKRVEEAPGLTESEIEELAQFIRCLVWKRGMRKRGMRKRGMRKRSRD